MYIGDVKFDYDSQTWSYMGKVIPDDQVPEDWVFPCPRCLGPSDIVRISGAGEHHDCLNPGCGHKFVVN